MAKEKKQKAKVEYAEQPESPTKKFDISYAIIAIIAAIVIFATVTSVYYVKNYIMFSPEKVAKQYVENTAKLDGYDALKYTLLIKNNKFGKFIQDNYMNQYIKEGEAPALSAEEAGDKLSAILDKMYPTFLDLVELNGFENYDVVFSEYFKEYSKCHNEIYGNDYFTTDDMFAAFEGNLATYMEAYSYDCEIVYGKGKDYAEYYLGKNKAILTDDEEKYSAGYSITAETEILKEYTDSEVSTYLNSISESHKAKYEQFGISTDDISAVAEIKTTAVLSGTGDQSAISIKNSEWKEHPQTITVVKIGQQWYVDFTA